MTSLAGLWPVVLIAGASDGGKSVRSRRPVRAANRAWTAQPGRAVMTHTALGTADVDVLRKGIQGDVLLPGLYPGTHDHP